MIRGRVDSHKARCSSSFCFRLSASAVPASVCSLRCKSSGALRLVGSAGEWLHSFAHVFALLCPCFRGIVVAAPSSWLPSCSSPGLLRTRRSLWDRPRLIDSPVVSTASEGSWTSSSYCIVAVFAMIGDPGEGMSWTSYTKVQG